MKINVRRRGGGEGLIVAVHDEAQSEDTWLHASKSGRVATVSHLLPGVSLVQVQTPAVSTKKVGTMQQQSVHRSALSGFISKYHR
jgi:chromate transport protein ChrA